MNENNGNICLVGEWTRSQMSNVLNVLMSYLALYDTRYLLPFNFNAVLYTDEIVYENKKKNQKKTNNWPSSLLKQRNEFTSFERAANKLSSNILRRFEYSMFKMRMQQQWVYSFSNDSSMNT